MAFAVDTSSLFGSAFLAKLEQLHLLSRKMFRGRQHAERRAPQTGSSLEFADYRNYTAGDDLRSVDWNIYGRLNRLFVKLFEAEQDLHVSILLDCSTSMHWQGSSGAPRASKFDYARQIAAALGYLTLANLDRVNLFPFDANLGADLGFVRGKQQFHAVLDFLKRLPDTPGAERRPTRMRACFQTFAHRLKRRGLVLVLSDLFDSEATDALGFLRRQQFEVAALQVLDPFEVDPSLSGDVRLVDSESGTAFDLLADSRRLAAYKAEFQRFVETVEQDCRRRAIGFVQTTTDVPFEDFVLQVLRKRRLLE